MIWIKFTSKIWNLFVAARRQTGEPALAKGSAGLSTRAAACSCHWHLAARRSRPRSPCPAADPLCGRPGPATCVPMRRSQRRPAPVETRAAIGHRRQSHRAPIQFAQQGEPTQIAAIATPRAEKSSSTVDDRKAIRKTATLRCTGSSGEHHHPQAGRTIAQQGRAHGFKLFGGQRRDGSCVA